MRGIVLLALLGAALAAPKNGNRIIGGSDTTVDRYPYMANMQYAIFSIWWMQACGGSLLTNTAVLSAAHCFEGDSPSSWRVRLGTTFAEWGGSVHPVSRITIHERYGDPYLDNDIAIVHLSVPAVYSTLVQPARIAGPNYILTDGTAVTAIGWGALDINGYYPDNLQHVEVNIINHELCTSRYAYLKTQPGFQFYPDITDSMLCAGILDIGGKDACDGDSGGPLAHDGDVVVGVTSWGYSCADPVYPGVNARVSSYTDWIIANA